MLRMPYWLATLGFSSVFNLENLDLAVEFLGDLFNDGSHHAARATPRCPEVDQTGISSAGRPVRKRRQVTAAALDILLK